MHWQLAEVGDLTGDMAISGVGSYTISLLAQAPRTMLALYLVPTAGCTYLTFVSKRQKGAKLILRQATAPF